MLSSSEIRVSALYHDKALSKHMIRHGSRVKIHMNIAISEELNIRDTSLDAYQGSLEEVKQLVPGRTVTHNLAYHGSQFQTSDCRGEELEVCIRERTIQGGLSRGRWSKCHGALQNGGSQRLRTKIRISGSTC